MADTVSIVVQTTDTDTLHHTNTVTITLVLGKQQCKYYYNNYKLRVEKIKKVVATSVEKQSNTKNTVNTGVCL